MRSEPELIQGAGEPTGRFEAWLSSATDAANKKRQMPFITVVMSAALGGSSAMQQMATVLVLFLPVALFFHVTVNNIALDSFPSFPQEPLGREIGRFWFCRLQHGFLRGADGRIVVYERGVVFRSLLAADVIFPFSQIRSVRSTAGFSLGYHLHLDVAGTARKVVIECFSSAMCSTIEAAFSKHHSSV